MHEECWTTFANHKWASIYYSETVSRVDMMHTVRRRIPFMWQKHITCMNTCIFGKLMTRWQRPSINETIKIHRTDQSGPYHMQVDTAHRDDHTLRDHWTRSQKTRLKVIDCETNAPVIRTVGRPAEYCRQQVLVCLHTWNWLQMMIWSHVPQRDFLNFTMKSTNRNRQPSVPPANHSSWKDTDTHANQNTYDIHACCQQGKNQGNTQLGIAGMNCY